MGYKLWAPEELLTSTDLNTYLAKQAVIVCTSGTRPASPVEGMTIFETDTDAYMTYTGTIWRPKAGPCVVVEKTTGFPANITTATWGSVTWSATRVLTDASMWVSGAPTRLVAPIPGWYAIEAVVSWSGTTATGSSISVAKNSTNTLRWRGNTLKGQHSGGDTQSVHAMVSMAAGDYVEIQLIAFGSTATLNQFDQLPWASMRYERPL